MVSILVFAKYYSPSYKAGGPVKTLQNMVEQLEDQRFLIATRDRDLGDKESFPDVKLNFWQELDRALVMYLPAEILSLRGISKVVNESGCQILYLNSFFDFVFTTKPLLASKFGMIKSCPVVLAPRGEFSAGALALKSIRKRFFIKLSGLLGLHDGIVWQASSELEKQDIISTLHVDPSSVFIAKDLPPKVSKNEESVALKPNETCRFVFLSRISPMKNLDFALRVLGEVKSSLVFDIYGPIEDETYWQHCLSLIEQLPSNIKVNYCGSVTPAQVTDVFSAYDLFLFPTRGENYGHVIAESLSAGTPVLLSDQTPWQGLEKDDLGWDLPLDFETFANKVEFVAKMDAQSRLHWRQQVVVNSVSKINNERDIADNIALFEFALDKFTKG